MKLRGAGRRLPFRLALLTICAVLVFADARPVVSFSSGPYSHAAITLQAIEQFNFGSDLRVSPECTELLVQHSIRNDSAAFAGRDDHHCDNNNIAGCSYRLDQFKGRAFRAASPELALLRAGMALHIIQDFYAHSNWAEIMETSLVLAPLETFKDVAPPRALQTGRFPDIDPDFEGVVACYLVAPERWRDFIPAATHACLNKDSARTPRGASPVPGFPLITLHELAGQYAIAHSRRFLEELARGSPAFAARCLAPSRHGIACNWLGRALHRNLR